jgi:hypothetical protein
MSQFGLPLANTYQLATGQTVPAGTDLLASTMNAMIPEIRRLFSLRRYSVLQSLLITPSGKIEYDGGAYGIEQRLEVADNNGAARGNRLFGTSTYVQGDYIKVCITPWVIDETTWQYDERMMARNRGNPQQIVRLMDTEMQTSLRGLLNRLEAQFLGTPANASDDLSHTGLLWWCRGLNTGVSSPGGGYNGIYAPYGDGTYTPHISRGNTQCDASDPTNTRLRGWAFTHDGTFSPLLVRQMRYALQQSEWQAPLFFNGIQGEPDRQWAQFRIHWDDNFNAAYADAVNSGPDDRNGNISPFYGDLKFGPAMTVATPSLNNIATRPILGVNYAQTRLRTMAGEWLAKSPAIRDGNQPTVCKQLIWCQSAVHCDDVRSNWIGHARR